PQRIRTSSQAACRRSSVWSSSVVVPQGSNALSRPMRWLCPPAIAKPIAPTSAPALEGPGDVELGGLGAVGRAADRAARVHLAVAALGGLFDDRLHAGD